ncbi:MAG: hypothetical protein AB7F75_01370 [Planctomycetota bacterium]
MTQESTQVASWKTELAQRRARRRGFKGTELEDALQDISGSLIGFQFDPARSNGASESTALTALIDKQLSYFRRCRARRRRREDLYMEQLVHIRGREPLDENPVGDFARAMDVWDIVNRLDPLMRQLCLALSRGDSVLQISKTLRMSRYHVDRLIEELRDQFPDWSLDTGLGAA